ncbi:RHS repeat-associated core domain-containing protein [Streptomyces adonidis]|uniref:RHS repeat-associated core domain-containing protein n=1 Tax=Streptomyces adonidis TaxID=3231367 RepID=UPI0034DB1205
MAGYRPADWHVLDLDKDPTPGDPHRVRQLARTLHDFADDVSDALRLIKGMASENETLEWAGKTAEVFQDEFADVPKNLKKLKRSYDLCGDALVDYWPKLERAQALADKALAKGREAQADLSSAKSRLSSADSWVTRATKESDKYKDDPTGSKAAEPPDEAKVRAATRDAQHAKSAQNTAQSDVDGAQSALDAAKKMAEDARKMREDAAGEAKRKIDEASDAGIQNRSWWEEVGDWFTDNWDSIVAVCKIVVAVVGVVAMIIGGPILGAIVLIAALVVLADTLYKYSKGQASLWDVGFAALDCIPGMKGLTTLGGLAKGMKSVGKLGLKGMAKGLGKGLRKGADDVVGKSKSAKGRCKNGDPIDMVSGEMLIEQTDVGLPGVLPVILRRTHLSTYHWGSWFGESWASTFDERLELDDDGALFATEDGMILCYPVPGPDRPVLPEAGPRWPLEWDADQPGALRVTDPGTGITRHFAPSTGAGERDSAFTLPLAALSDRNGNRVHFDRTPDGTPVAVRHSGGYHVHVDTADGRIVRLRLRNPADGPEGTTILSYGYDEAGDLTELHDSSGLPFTFTYDLLGRIGSWTDRIGSWYRFTYDDHDRVIRGEGADGVLDCTIAYDAEAHATHYTDSLSRTTSYRHNERRQLVSTTNARGESVHNEWDDTDRLVARTDALDHTFRYEYDDAGNLTRVTRPDGSATSAVFNEFHRPVVVTEEAGDEDGVAWRHSYDERGNRIATRNPTGAETHYTYDASGFLTGVTDALGNRRDAACDGVGLPVRLTNPLGSTTTVEHDAFGRITSVMDALGRVTRLGWTVEGRLAWRASGDEPAERFAWDGAGNLVTYTDPAGNTSSYTPTHFHLAAVRTRPNGSRYTFDYDTELNLTRVTNPQGATWDYVYDEANRVVAETDFNGRTLTYDVNAMGALVSLTNGAGETVSFGRDALGRTTSVRHDGHTTSLRYDSRGRLVEQTGPEVWLHRAYDTVGRLVAESVNGSTTTYRYDALGRRVERRTPSGTVSTWSYDAAGRPVGLESAGRMLGFDFDAAGREIARELGHGVTLGQSWDEAGRLTTQTLSLSPEQHPEGAETLLQHRTYVYRADGHLAELDELTTGTRRFDLDPVGRVTAVHARDWTETYAYDGVGNLSGAVTPVTAADDTHREFTGTLVRRCGRTRYERDAEGRVVRSVRRLLNGQKRVRTYTWNSLSQLVGIVTPGGARWHYLYDPTGRRVAKRRVSDDGAVVEETRFTWDGPRLAEQVTPGGHSITWDYAPGTHLPLTQIDRGPGGPGARGGPDGPDAGTRFHAVVTDLSGAPAELISEEGALVWQRRTTLWGLPLPGEDTAGASSGRSADTVDCPLRFPGQYADAETGWHYNHHRYYDPETGHYATPDPLGLGPASNDTAYVPNPYRWIDPLGLYRDTGNGQYAHDPDAPETAHNRKSEYPSGYRESTHDEMAKNWTLEGVEQGERPLDSGKNKIPRDQLTWFDGNGDIIWDPANPGSKPFSETVTYEHREAVVDHWNRDGRLTDRAARNDFYNEPDNMEAMEKSKNSRAGAMMEARYSQETGPNYSCS